jgi:hypothetical protein
MRRAHQVDPRARYKVPEAFIIRALPRNAMGKVNLVEVRQSVQDLDLNILKAQ